MNMYTFISELYIGECVLHLVLLGLVLKKANMSVENHVTKFISECKNIVLFRNGS